MARAQKARTQLTNKARIIILYGSGEDLAEKTYVACRNAKAKLGLGLEGHPDGRDPAGCMIQDV